MLAQGGLGNPNLAALAGGGLAVSLELFVNDNIFHFPIMVNLPVVPINIPALFEDPDIFHVPAVVGIAGQIIPESMASQIQFFDLRIDQELIELVGNFQNQNQFYAPTLTFIASQGIAPELVVDPDIFYDPFVDLVDKTLELATITSGNVFWPMTVDPGEKPIVYDYPIGRSLEADYGIRNSMTFYKRRLIIGRRR